jgi:hypothetical protein
LIAIYYRVFHTLSAKKLLFVQFIIRFAFIKIAGTFRQKCLRLHFATTRGVTRHDDKHSKQHFTHSTNVSLNLIDNGEKRKAKSLSMSIHFREAFWQNNQPPVPSSSVTESYQNTDGFRY